MDEKNNINNDQDNTDSLDEDEDQNQNEDEDEDEDEDENEDENEDEKRDQNIYSIDLVKQYCDSIPEYYEDYWLLKKIKSLEKRYKNLNLFDESDLMYYRARAGLSGKRSLKKLYPEQQQIPASDLLLLDFSGKFKDMQTRSRKYDNYVLNEQTLQIEKIHEKFASIFLEYLHFLSTPLNLKHPPLPSLVDNFYEHCIKNKVYSENLGYQYKFARNFKESQISVDIKEILHIKGLQIVRDLNHFGEDIVIKTNDFDAGFIEYDLNYIKTDM